MERENIKEIVGRCIFVALGSFNPAILHPEWLSRHKILPEEEIVGLFAEPLRKEIPELGAIIEFGQNFVVSPTQTSLHLKSFILNVTREKFEIRCEKREKFPLMIDSVKKIFLLLSETPIKAYGLNFDEHIKFDKTLSEIAANFFTETDNIKKVFGDDFLVGHKIIAKVGEATLTFNFEPSPVMDDGVFFKFNFHYDNDAPDTKFIVDKISVNLEQAITFTENLLTSFCGNMIERKGKIR
jgi:hypothetical protein